MYLRQASSLAARRATAGSIRSLATGKDVKFGVEGRALMLQGVDMLADAVQVGLRQFSSRRWSRSGGQSADDVAAAAAASLSSVVTVHVKDESTLSGKLIYT